MLSESSLPAEKDFTIDKTNGELYHANGSANQNWNRVWKSNDTPQLQFGCGPNNMNWTGNNVQLMTGVAGSATYTLTAPAGYIISEYSFTFTNNGHDTALDLTMDDGTAYRTLETAQTISKKNQRVSSVSFVLAGSNGKGVVLTDFTVKIKEDVIETAKISTEGNEYWYYITSASTKNYCAGKVIYYDAETEKLRFGDLAISVRAGGYNYHNYTSDDGATWHLPSQTRFTTGISGNACDGEYMVWCSTVEGNPWDIAFQTLPHHSSRQNVSIALSTDEGETFGAPKTICPRGSAYSAAVVLPDGTLGVYYEENGVYDGFVMRFVRFSLDWASGGAYKFTDEYPFYSIKSTNPSSIEEVREVSASRNLVYDLMGCRVQNPAKGIYIVNGKKMEVR